MHYHVDRLFPGAAPLIEALASEKKDFASLLADYEELSTWLAVRERSAKTDDEEIGNVRELIKELENEIRQQLEKYDEHPC
mgnify:CR=1 FL=1